MNKTTLYDLIKGNYIPSKQKKQKGYEKYHNFKHIILLDYVGGVNYNLVSKIAMPRVMKNYEKHIIGEYDVRR